MERGGRDGYFKGELDLPNLFLTSPIYLRVGYFVQLGTLQHPGAVVYKWKKIPFLSKAHGFSQS